MLKEAETHLRKAIELIKKYYGEEHPNYNNIKINLEYISKNKK